MTNLTSLPIEKFILFIQLDKKLPKYFFNLSIKLSKEGIKLIPIPAKNLNILSKKKHFFIMSVVSTLKACKEYQVLRHKFLDYALLNNRFSIIEVNSFYKFEISNRLQENRSYSFIKLPVSMNNLVNEVTDIYNRRNPLWPGGRKGKLPLMES